MPDQYTGDSVLDLFYAAKSGRCPRAKKILESGVDPNFLMDYIEGNNHRQIWCAPLTVALEKKNMKMARLLLQFGARFEDLSPELKMRHSHLIGNPRQTASHLSDSSCLEADSEWQTV